MAAVRIEDVKAEGIAVDIDALAATGFESISDADRYRLKTQGICTQRQVGVFMLRIRVPGGAIDTRALRTVASLSQRYGAPIVHVTTRGGLELHHVKIEDVRAVFNELESVGLTTKGTCGDTVRNVIACAHDEAFTGAVVPLSGFVTLLHERIVAVSDATNISRKMNVSIACSPDCDDHVATSDIGFVATPSADGAAPTFTLWGAGGLGAAPRLAIELARDIAQSDVLAAYDAVVEIGKKYGDRSSRAKAKIKMLVEKLGAERVREIFREEFEAARARPDAQVADVGPVLATAPSVETSCERKTVHGLVPMGELAADAAFALAGLVDRVAGGKLVLTPEQNVQFVVAASDYAAATDELDRIGLRTRGRGGIADVLSCVGLEYCPLAVAHSMTMGEELAVAFGALADDPMLRDFRIHVSGCPHSCAKHQVADIGLAGAMTDLDGVKVEAYAMYVGGNPRERRLGTAYPKKVPRAFVVRVVTALIETFRTERIADERFSQTVARVGVDAFFETIRATLEPPPKIAAMKPGGRLVIVGNGMAGARLAEDVRERAPEGFEIVVIGEEPHGGYNRIALSGVLGGHREHAEIVTHPIDWYAGRNVALHHGVRATAIDRENRVVRCEDGREVAYDALVLATGSRAFVPPIAGIADVRSSFVFRTVADCDAIAAAAQGKSRAIVLGGGLLGLEAAAGLRARGLVPTVVHLAPTLMEVQLDVYGGRALQRAIENLGIVVRTGAATVRAFQDENGCGIELAGGETLHADLIVVCCGTKPNVELAREAGLTVGRAIAVDHALQTSDPAIFALGECAEFRGELYGLVEPIWEQCRVLADRLNGVDSRYAGSRISTRLKVAGITVVALGVRDARDGDEAVSALSHDGKFKRAIARDGVLVGAQVVGDGRAAADFARAFDRGTPLPGSLAAFVFGVEGASAAAPEGPRDDDRICVCNEVSRGEILAAISAGAHDVAEIGRQTLAGTGCGTCRGELATLVIEAKTQSAN
jgi:NAD(P)H-nitrite reductase large subunit